MFKIKSLTAQVHDTSYGGYPFKIVAVIEVDNKAFLKLPILRRTPASMFGPAKTSRDLGSLVVAVNNAVYAVNRAIPAYNPSIDPRGEKRAKNGVKTMIFEYFSQDYEAAKLLGFKVAQDKNGNQRILDFATRIDLLKNDKKSA